jgi:hypothetical protein
MKKLNCKRGTTIYLGNPMLKMQFALMQTGKLGVLTPDQMLKQGSQASIKLLGFSAFT